MKIWKLISGILCIVFSAMVLFQSCAAGVVTSIEENAADTSAGGGMVLAILMLAGGIISIAVRNGGKGGNIALLVIFLLAALAGFANQGIFKDLMIWAGWCLICAILAFIGVLTSKKTAPRPDAPQ